jgi:hypothetical protein
VSSTRLGVGVSRLDKLEALSDGGQCTLAWRHGIRDGDRTRLIMATACKGVVSSQTPRHTMHGDVCIILNENHCTSSYSILLDIISISCLFSRMQHHTSSNLSLPSPLSWLLSLLIVSQVIGVQVRLAISRVYRLSSTPWLFGLRWLSACLVAAGSVVFQSGDKLGQAHAICGRR